LNAVGVLDDVVSLIFQKLDNGIMGDDFLIAQLGVIEYLAGY